jgi:hypothetical protein
MASRSRVARQAAKYKKGAGRPVGEPNAIPRQIKSPCVSLNPYRRCIDQVAHVSRFNFGIRDKALYRFFYPGGKLFSWRLFS